MNLPQLDPNRPAPIRTKLGTFLPSPIQSSIFQMKPALPALFTLIALLPCSLTAEEVGRKVTVDTSNCCSLEALSGVQAMVVYEPRPKEQAELNKILEHTGLQPNFIFVRSPEVGNNAFAAMVKGQRTIFYSTRFMDRMNEDTGSKWACISILAHEIGHHLQGHTLDQQGSRPKTELEADRFCGYVLSRMNAPLKEATAAIEAISSENGSDTHPPRYARVAAITDGWNKAKKHIKDQVKTTPLEEEQKQFLQLTNTSEKATANTWRWSAYIDADAKTLARIESVTYRLHELMDDPVRTKSDPANRFAINATTRGGFSLKAVITFKDGKPKETLRHELQLTK